MRCDHATWQAIQVAAVTSIRLVRDTRGMFDGIVSIFCLIDETLDRRCGVESVLPRSVAEVSGNNELLPTFVGGRKVDAWATNGLG